MEATVQKSYRSVDMCDPDAMQGAASYLSREWGEGRRLGFAGRWTDSFDRVWSVFQCAAGDGSRWLIRADRFGNCGTFDLELERELGLLFDVEVSS